MKAIFYQHDGLGDLFIHFGYIMEKCLENKYEEINIITQEYNKECFFQLFKYFIKHLNIDVKLIPFCGHSQSINLVNNFYGDRYSCWWYGFSGDDIIENLCYSNNKIPSSKRYDNFRIAVEAIRDENREQEIFKQMVGQSEEPYIFVADDPKRNYVFDQQFINKNCRIVKSSDYLQFTPIDMLKVIERSVEFHCMYSSFFFFYDQFRNSIMNNPVIHLHETYVKRVDAGPKHKKFFQSRNIVHH